MFRKISQKMNQKASTKSIILTILALFILTFSLVSFTQSSYSDTHIVGGTKTSSSVVDQYQSSVTVDSNGDLSIKSDADASLGLHSGSFVVGNIAEELLSVIVYGGYKLLDIALLLLNTSFVPSLSPLLRIEQGKSVLIHKGTTADTSISIDDSIIISTLWKFAFTFGLITATLIVLLNLFLCLVGRSDDIKDTPVMLLIKYTIAVFMIFVSQYFMTGFINLYGDIWNNLVLGSGITTTEMAVSQGLNAATIIPIIKVGGQWSVFGLGMNVLAAAGHPILSVILPLILLIVGLVCAVTLLKELLKLFLEIVERYFVFIMLIAFFPIMAATISSNNSKRIFYSYIKIVYTQGFLLIINTIFMAIFFFVALKGGWVAGILNYLAALAFLRLCQRIDAYMAQMGIGVVQTGSVLANAIGHSGMGLFSALKALQMADRGRQNIGKGVRDLGVRQNSGRTHAIGSVLGSTAGGLIGGSASTQALSNSFASEHSKMVSAFQNGMGAGLSTSLAGSNGSWDSLRGAMMSNGMNEIAAGNAISGIQAAGYQPGDISGMIQNDKNASSFSFETDQGGKGGIIATVDGSGDGDSTQVIPASDMEAALKQQEAMEQGGTYGDMDDRFTTGAAITSDMDGAEGDMARYIDKQDQATSFEQGSDSLAGQDAKNMAEIADSSAGVTDGAEGNYVATVGKNGTGAVYEFPDTESASAAISSDSDTADFSKATSKSTFSGRSNAGTGTESDMGSWRESKNDSSSPSIDTTRSTARFNSIEEAKKYVETQTSATPLTRQDRVVYTPGTAGDAVIHSRYGNTEVQRPIYAAASHPEMRGDKRYTKASFGGREYYIDEKGSRPSPGRKKSGRPNAQGKPRVSNPGNSPTRKDGKRGSGKPKN